MGHQESPKYQKTSYRVGVLDFRDGWESDIGWRLVQSHAPGGHVASGDGLSRKGWFSVRKAKSPEEAANQAFKKQLRKRRKQFRAMGLPKRVWRHYRRPELSGSVQKEGAMVWRLHLHNQVVEIQVLGL